MKTYEFFYFDSFENHKKNEFKKYILESPRFDSALKIFANFLEYHDSDYIAFDYAYMVTSDSGIQARALTYRDILYLLSIKDKHNAKFWETHDEN